MSERRQPAGRRAGGTVRDHERAGGAPVLVLGNSLGTTRELWEPQLESWPAGSGCCGTSTAGTAARPRHRALRISELGCGRAARCSTTSGSVPRRTAASRSAAWSACGSPRTCRSGSRYSRLCCTSARLPPGTGLWADRAAAVRGDGLARSPRQVVGRWFTPAFQALIQSVPAAFVAAPGRRRPGRVRGLLRGDRGHGPPAALAWSPRPRWSFPGRTTRQPRRGTGP